MSHFSKRTDPNQAFHVANVAEGLKVCSYQTDRFKTGRLSFNMILPLEVEPARFAILPYLLVKSCKAYPTYLDLNKKLADLYGASLNATVSKMGENLVLRLTMTMIDNKFAFQGEDLFYQCAELLCQIVFEPNLTEQGVFPSADVEREKRLLGERIESLYNDKRSYALLRCTQIMCAEEKYSVCVYGTQENVAALTPEQVTDAWKEALAKARIQVDIVGNVEATAVGTLVKGYLSKVTRQELTEVDTEVRNDVANVKREVEEQPVKQGKLVLGFRTGMQNAYADYPTFRVFSDLFGGGTYSRLFENVREKQSLCYYCSSRYYSAKGILVVQSGIENENAEKAIQEINAQLADMAAGNVTEEDLEKSHKSMTDGLKSVCDTPEDIDAWFASQLVDPVFETPLEEAERMKAVTREDVIRAAQSLKLDTIFLLRGTGIDEEVAD